ncbi:hypothetical protein [Variovorax sp. GT1P44]|uniref:hypothetical protein n=1 Tax=Variovorax sp. GT1P44 TaxID=3443742 RepID=UPI003F4810FA
MELEPMDWGTSCHADLFDNGTFVCRIVLAGTFRSTATAEADLNFFVDRWIEEHELIRGETERHDRSALP